MARLLVSGAAGFLMAIAIEVVADNFEDAEKILSKAREELMKEKEIYRDNPLAWAVVTQVMAREKGNIELAFLGFM